MREVLRDPFDSFANAVADHEQQEMAAGEAARHIVHERRLINRVVLFPHELEQRGDGVLIPSAGPTDRCVQLLVRPAADLLGVIEDLGDGIAAALRVGRLPFFARAN